MHTCMLSCWCWYIYMCNFAFFLVGFSCEFTNCLVSSWFASFLMEFLKQEKNAILLVTDLQVADVALCQMAWDDVLWLLLMKLIFSGFRLAINLQRTSVVLCQVPWDGREYPQKVEEEVFLLWVILAFKYVFFDF